MKTKYLAVILISVGVMAGCTQKQVLGSAAGAAAAGASYEAYNKKRLDDARDDFKNGKITQEEYDRRKKEIEDRSAVY